MQQTWTTDTFHYGSSIANAENIPFLWQHLHENEYHKPLATQKFQGVHFNIDILVVKSEFILRKPSVPEGVEDR